MKNIFKPILFSTPMVQAILEGRKTQTRRIVKAEFPENSKFMGNTVSEEKGLGFYFSDGTAGNMQGFFPSLHGDLYSTYQAGDIIWVRETFTEQEIESNQILYKADYTNEVSTKLKKYTKWKPSIFMPKKACRIFLKVVSVKVERLQDISEADSISEGAIQFEDDTDWLTAKYGFQIIWENINGKDSWNKNPFVWVYEFEQIEKPLDFI